MSEPLTVKKLLELVRSYRRVGITGAPDSGKTYITEDASAADPTLCVLHGDDYLREGPEGWSGCSLAIAEALRNESRPFIAEGVQIPRAMRKGLKLGCLVVLEGASQLACPRAHAVMTKGIETVLAEVRRHPDHASTVVLRFGPQY